MPSFRHCREWHEFFPNCFRFSVLYSGLEALYLSGVYTIIHVRRTCAMNVYTVAHIRRACATYTSHMHDVHVRRTCLHYHTCTAYRHAVHVRRTCMIIF